MKKQDRVSIPAAGGASALVIFAVLCLCVLALLAVNTVLAEKRMVTAAIESSSAYYAADLEAQKLFARLRNGEQVPGVKTEDSTVSFSCEISDSQRLEVQLRKTGDVWTVLRWQAAAESEEHSDTLPVWDGT